MSLIAITHTLSPKLPECELTHLERIPIDMNKALAEHEHYLQVLKLAGYEVIEYSFNADYPDCVFVEDTAIVVDELAVITNPGAGSRRGETINMAKALGEYRTLAYISGSATLDGGDVLQVGRKFFVGITTRTNRAGFESLKVILEPYDYQVYPIEVTGSLHLKSAVTALDSRTVIAAVNWVDTSQIEAHCQLIAVAEGEEPAANVLWLGETIYMADGYPRTKAIIKEAGYAVETINIHELQKAESGLTCSSLLFTR
jgi:dimethylargininase